jgi:hypothetical protein
MQMAIDDQPARRSNFRRLLIGTCAVAFVVTLSIVIAAGRVPRPVVESLPQPVVASAGAAQPASVRPPDSDPPVTVQPTALPKWVGRRQAAWAGDWTKKISFALDAIADVPVGNSRTRPQLVARCLSRTVDVYIVTGPLSFEPQTGSHTVRVQVDDDPPESQKWSDSDGSRELFAPDGAGLSDRLARARRLRVGFTPFNTRPVTAEFVVEGFDELAPLITRACAPVSGRALSRLTIR